MINRILIRIKTVQLLYAFYQAGDRFVESVESELLKSLSKSYELYIYLLQLMIDITRMADEIVNDQEERNRVAHVDTVISHRFIDNAFIRQLADNTQLMQYVEHNKLSWANDRDLLRKLYAAITESEYYAEYMMRESVTYDDDRELWRKAYKNVIMKADYIDDVLEEKSIYWNDDKETVDTFVLKTIKRFDPANGAEQELMPEFKDEEDRDFALTLIRRAIENDKYYLSLISQSTRNWEFNRLAYMDVIIMQIALAEMLTFPEIPVSVTINEYVELAKCYSTPKSHIYINGILDNIAKRLISERKILKN